MGNFIQIGAGAGDLDTRVGCRDGFSELVKSLDPSMIGKIVLVEPNPINIPFLEKCWANYPQAEIHNIGICVEADRNSTIRFYYAEEDAPNYQVFSMVKDHVLKHYPNVEPKHTDVNCIPLLDLIDKSIGLQTEIELLSLDIEGIDAEILLDTDWSRVNCNLLSFEHLHIPAQLHQTITNHLNDCGLFYVGPGIDVHGYDTLFGRKN